MRWLEHVPIESLKLPYTGHHLARERTAEQNNMEEDNYIRAGGSGFYYGPGSVRCNGAEEDGGKLLISYRG